MTSPALAHAVSTAEWMAAVDRYGWAEVVAGRLVVLGESERAMVTENRHDVVARRLANAFEEAWGLMASAPATWRVHGESASVREARIPDVLVGDDSLLDPGPFIGHPVAVVEVWSPSNTFGEILSKRHEYLTGGARAMIEVAIDAFGTVSLSWFVRAEEPLRWELHAFATGDEPLHATLPQPFTLVPNHLLAPLRRR